MKKLIIILSLSLIIVTASWARPFGQVIKDAQQQGFVGVISFTNDNKQQIQSVNQDDFDDNTQFAIGSISKLFTQVAILQLAESGQLNLNASIDSYLDTRRFPGDWQAWMPKVTVKDLLEHRSGLPALLYWHEGTQAIFNHAGEHKSLRQLFFSGENIHLSESVIKENLAKADEQGVYYSNVGYNLLALIIENVSGLTYDDYLRIHIFDKAEMNNSFSGTTNDFAIYQLISQHDRMAKPNVYAIHFNTRETDDTAYRVSVEPKNLKSERDYNFVFSNGAGSVISTVSDLNKWIRALFITKQLLTTETFQHYLLQLDQEDGLWGHQGELPGYQSILLYDLNQKRTVVILSNLNYDMYALYHELVELSGKHIKNFELRGGEMGIENELSTALDKSRYVLPVNIAIDLLSDTNK